MTTDDATSGIKASDDRPATSVTDSGKRNTKAKTSGQSSAKIIPLKRRGRAGDHCRALDTINLDAVQLPPELAQLDPKSLAICILRNVGYSLNETCKAVSMSKSGLVKLMHKHGWIRTSEGRQEGIGLPPLPDDLLRAYRISKYQRLETLAVDQTIAKLPEASARDASQIAERASTQLHLHRVQSDINTPSLQDVRLKLAQSVKPESVAKVIDV